MNEITLRLPTDKVSTILPELPTSTRRDFLTKIPGTEGEYLLVLDNTALSKIKRCHKAGQNYLILGREPHARNGALVYGGAMHEGLEVFHNWEYFSRQPLALESPADEQAEYKRQMFEAAEAKIRKFFTENPCPPDEWRTVTNCVEVFKRYRRRCDPLLHPDYEWDILADSQGPIIERSFELPLTVLEGVWNISSIPETITKIHVAWSGRIDMAVKANTKKRIVDHKTSSIDSDQFIQAFTLASQTIGYVWAAKRLWPEEEISGFLLNVLCLKNPRGKSLVELGPRGGEGPLKFFRAYFDYSPMRIARWESDTIALIEDFLHSLSREHFPLNDNNCFDKFGRCPYWDACVFDSESVGESYVLSDAYKQVTWNPVDER